MLVLNCSDLKVYRLLASTPMVNTQPRFIGEVAGGDRWRMACFYCPYLVNDPDTCGKDETWSMMKIIITVIVQSVNW